MTTPWLLGAPEWRALWVGAADHVWQTTLCVALAAVLAAIVGARRPQIRFWIWLAASIKFLVPFSILMTAGRALAQSIAPLFAAPPIPAALEAVGQPFTVWAVQATAASASAPSTFESAPVIIAAIWLTGALAIVVSIWTRRRRVVLAIAESRELTAGREHLALQRLLERRIAGAAMTIRETPVPFEPGLVGVRRPVLLWPAGLSERLDDAEIESIVTHEMCHARRADNLTAHVHMFVETLFWFHPLVWWLGARLIAEREHACDQDVLSQGAHPETYAQSLLTACRFCLHSPLPSVAGITGSSLTRRVEAIMTFRPQQPLGSARRLLLAIGACGVVFGPIAAGAAAAHPVVVISAVGGPARERAAFRRSATSGASDAGPVAIQQTPARPVRTPAAPAQPAPVSPVRDQVIPAAPIDETADAAEIAEFRRGAFHPGGPVTVPRVLTQVKTPYTAEALRLKIQGSVTLEVVVGPDGLVARARVTRSLDKKFGLDEEALKAARQWTFEPARLDGQPVAVICEMELDFKLH